MSINVNPYISIRRNRLRAFNEDVKEIGIIQKDGAPIQG